jgi:hypothetical protein
VTPATAQVRAARAACCEPVIRFGARRTQSTAMRGREECLLSVCESECRCGGFLPFPLFTISPFFYPSRLHVLFLHVQVPDPETRVARYGRAKTLWWWWWWCAHQLRITSGRLPRIWGSIRLPIAALTPGSLSVPGLRVALGAGLGMRAPRSTSCTPSWSDSR